MKYSTRTSGSLLATLLLAATLTACAGTARPAPVAPAEQASSQTATQSETTTTTVAAEVAPAAVALTKLNLNTVSGDELLATIPDFGNRMVREFHEYRPYVSIQQFRKEIGKYVDEAQVAEYEKYVFVPININESDAATLMQIPGVDESKAQELVAARPFASQDAFLEILASYLSPEQVAVAKGYLEAQ